MRNPVKVLQERIDYRKDCRKVFSTPEGRRVLLRLCAITGITKRSQFSSRAEDVMWQEAQRHLVHSLVRDASVGEDELLQQIEEIERSMSDERLDEQNSA